MDRYKFRGKRLDNGEWVVGSLLKLWITEVVPADYDDTSEYDFEDRLAWFIVKETNADYEFDDDNRVEVDPSTVGQFTCLKDKNGKEIYEGDIVKTTSLLNDHNQKGATNILIVRNYMGNSCLCFSGYDSGTPIYPVLISQIIEVIGNIHDNPEHWRGKG